MRIIIAPDSFKGCLMAWDVAQAIAVGVDAALPHAEVLQMPLGDGGEGTARAIATAVPLSRTFTAQVLDPLGRLITSEFVLLPGGRAVVEMAAASGLGLPSRRSATRCAPIPGALVS
jgi:glycerate 2-kinase